MNAMKFALIGTGNIATTYVNAVKNLDCADIVGVISRSTERAEKFAAEHDIKHFADSLQSLTCDFDAVFVATPNGLHRDGAITAAEIGKHVLVEKPLEITTEKLDSMIEACSKAGVKLGTTYQRRTSENNIIIQKMLSKKEFGKIYAIDLSLKLYRGQEYYDSAKWRGTLDIDGGGPFIQQGSHDIDILCWFFGMPKKVFAKTGTFAHKNIEVEDYGTAILEYADGSLCTIVASTISKPGFSPKLEVTTELGTFSMTNDEITTWDIEGIENPCKTTEADRHSSATSASVSDTSGHEKLITDFVNSIIEDKDPVASATKGRCASDVILAIYKSANDGKEISI
jgi:predicted dehydrogenase